MHPSLASGPPEVRAANPLDPTHKGKGYTVGFELFYELPLGRSSVSGTVLSIFLALCPLIVTNAFDAIILISQVGDLKVQSGDVTCQIAHTQAEPGPKPRLEANFV